MARCVLSESGCHRPQQISLASLTRRTAVLVYESGPIGAKLFGAATLDWRWRSWPKQRIRSYRLQKYFATGCRVEGLTWAFLARRNSTSLQTSSFTVVRGLWQAKGPVAGSGRRSRDQFFGEGSTDHREAIETDIRGEARLCHLCRASYRGNAREAAGLSGNGPAAVITDLCILRPDPESRELKVVNVHPGVNREKILASTGWSLRFADSCEERQDHPRLNLKTLRDLKPRTAAVHGTQGDRE